MDTGFQILPKKWLSDANILTMDWDCQGMHLFLMCIAFQQEKSGFLLNDDTLLMRVLRLSDVNDFSKRIKPQLLKCWKISKVKENGTQVDYLSIKFNKDFDGTSNVKEKTKKSKKVQTSEDFEHPDKHDGFSLIKLLKFKPQQTILYEKPEKATEKEKSTIWNLGVEIFLPHFQVENKARAFIAKNIKEYGEKNVAKAIAELSTIKQEPAHIVAFFIGILKKHQEGVSVRKTGRGSVSI
jgi:hypothetical protein